MNDVFQLIADVCRRSRTEPFLVGGSVRDGLLNLPSQDWDLVCVKARSVASAVAGRLSRKLITLDEQHRIYRIVLPGHEGGRAVTLDFAEMQGGTLQKDLARRDFTMNAMALPLTRSAGRGTREKEVLIKNTSSRIPRPASRVDVIDPFGGQKDLRRKIVRALSRKAFQKDPLRLLRAYRMAAQFDFTIDPRTARWIKADNALLEDSRSVARERVREELLRLLSQPRAASVLFAMDGSGLLTTLFPELEAGRRVGLNYYGKGGVIKHHLQSVANVEWILEQLDAETRRHGDTEKHQDMPAVSPRTTPVSMRGTGLLNKEQGGARHRVTASPRLMFISREILPKIEAYIRQRVGGWPRAAYLKLGALLHDLGKPATAEVIRGRLRFFGHEDVGARMVQKLMAGMRFSRQEGSLIRRWVQNHMRPGSLASVNELTDKAVARFFRDLGEDGVGMLLVSLGDHYTYLSRTQWGKGTDAVEKTSRRLLETYYLQREAVLPPKIIDGNILMKKLRLKPGPVIGRLLEAVRDAQVEGKVKTVEDALALAKKRAVIFSGRVQSLPRRGPNRSA